MAQEAAGGFLRQFREGRRATSQSAAAGVRHRYRIARPRGSSRNLPRLSANRPSPFCAICQGGTLDHLRSHDQLDQTWAEVRDNLRLSIPEDVFRVWLEPLRPIALKDGTLYLQASQQTCDWIRRRFGTALTRALATAGSACRQIELVSDPHVRGRGKRAASYHVQLKPAYCFDEFVIGVSNRFAHAAALAVAELPGQAYNPLFLYGPPGVGKTHLTQAIGNYIALNDSRLEVRYATVESFTSEFTNALRTSAVHHFKRAYREADVLLLDDVQSFESKPKTAEEFFHTFDALLGSGSQVVITADRPPSTLPLIESRLRERFEAGLVVDLQRPDFPTRLSIVRKRAGTYGLMENQAGVLEYLARRVSTSVRTLEGALVRSRAYASLTQQPLTVDLVEHVLTTLQASGAAPELDRPSPTIECIQQVTSAALRLSATDLNSPKRSRQVVYARQLAMYLCRELTSLSLPAIGKGFGGRDHTTVLHAHRQIRSRIFSDSAVRELVERLVENLQRSDGQHLER
jgi:chromosomal replication initiator protein